MRIVLFLFFYIFFFIFICQSLHIRYIPCVQHNKLLLTFLLHKNLGMNCFNFIFKLFISYTLYSSSSVWFIHSPDGFFLSFESTMLSICDKAIESNFNDKLNLSLDPYITLDWTYNVNGKGAPFNVI